MNRLKKIYIAVTASILLVACGASEPPDVLPISEYERVMVSVWGYTPDGNEYFLGDTKGASSCGDIAHSWASDNRFHSSPNWGYVCCTHEAESRCYRKIR